MAIKYGYVLEKALRLINEDRREDYGDVHISFADLANMWSVYLGKSISSKDVAVCMTLLKICREKNKHKEDNLVDAAGYIGLAADLVPGAVEQVSKIDIKLSPF